MGVTIGVAAGMEALLCASKRFVISQECFLSPGHPSRGNCRFTVTPGKIC